jgi:hypothetical protein
VNHIVLGFAHSSSVIGDLIKWFTHGRYSHVMLMEPGGRRYIESSAFNLPPGVHMHDLSRFIATKSEWDFRRIPHPNPVGVWNVACTQVGKPYDDAYIFGWLLHRNWQHPGKWSCNELIAWACEKAGHPIIDMAEPQWLTPQHLYLISQPLE